MNRSETILMKCINWPCLIDKFGIAFSFKTPCKHQLIAFVHLENFYQSVTLHLIIWVYWVALLYLVYKMIVVLWRTVVNCEIKTENCRNIFCIILIILGLHYCYAKTEQLLHKGIFCFYIIIISSYKYVPTYCICYLLYLSLYHFSFLFHFKVLMLML